MRYLTLLKDSYFEWRKDKASQMAAALAYYTVFSLAPLLIIVISVGGIFFGEKVVEEQVFSQLESFVGTTGAEVIRSMLTAASQSPNSGIATAIGILTLVIGATGVMVALQNSLNAIWHVELKPHSRVKNILRRRFLSITLILAIGFLLLVSLMLSTVVSVFIDYFSGSLPTWTLALPLISTLATFAVSFALFSMLFKFLPDVRVPWKHVLTGALWTAVLFTVGKALIGLYLGRRDILSTYGVAGSVIVVLLWVYYSAQIFFFGAEFTKIHAKKKHAVITPYSHARFIGTPDEKRLKLSLMEKARLTSKILMVELKTVRKMLKAKAVADRMKQRVVGKK